MSYQKLNQVTHPFAFPVPRCDDVVQEIYTGANYFIVVDMDSGYWQVVAEEEARKRLALFSLDGKLRRKLMPMGDLNSAPTFVAMMMKLKWNDTHNLKNVVWKMLHQNSLLLFFSVWAHSRESSILFQNSNVCP